MDRLAAGEAPTKRALGVERANALRTHIKERVGRTMGHNQEIERAFRNYYKDLFAFRSVDLEAFEFISAVPRIDDEYEESLNQPIAVAQVECAIDNLNNGKALGSCGLNAAFYRAFKNNIAPLLAVLFNEALELKALRPSCGEVPTMIIPKTENTDELKMCYIISSHIPEKCQLQDFHEGSCAKNPICHQTAQACAIKGRTIFFQHTQAD